MTGLTLHETPLGAQRPRICCVPPAATSAGQDAVELAALAGLVLDPWQEYVLEGALGEVGGRHAAFEVGLIVPRQNGKGSILEARELAGLFLLGERMILHSAHEFKTAQEGFRRILYLIENTPDFDSQILKVSHSHGDEGIELKSGQRLRFVARSRGSGRGFTGDCVIFDEAYNLDSRAMDALMPTLSARPNPQLWYASSAGQVDSEQLRDVRARGIAGNSARLAYFEHSADDSDAVSDDDTVDTIDVTRLLEVAAQANPAMGIRIPAEFIVQEFESLTADGFNRERLGIWDDPTSGGVFDSRKWADCWDTASCIDGALTFAVEVAQDREFACIGAAGYARHADDKSCHGCEIGDYCARHSHADECPDDCETNHGDDCAVDETENPPSTELIHIESVDYRPGTAWLLDRCVQLAEKNVAAAFLVQSNSPAGTLITDLQHAGLYVIEVTAPDFAKACGQLFDAVRDTKMRHIGQSELDSAQRGARKKNAGDGSFIWDRRTESVDISPLSAATLAFWGFLEHGSRDITDSVW